MRILLLLLITVLLLGCASPGVYRWSPSGSTSSYTAYAISPSTLLSLSHDPITKGQVVRVETTRGPISGAVLRNYGEVVVIGTTEELIPGDSGAAIIRSRDGSIVGFVWARPATAGLARSDR